MFTVRRIRPEEGARLRSTRLAALADAPGESNTTLARARSHGDDHWSTSAAANASGPLQATFFAEIGGPDADGETIGLIGAYANRGGVVNLVGLWSAPGHRDIGVASALIDAVAEWARGNGDDRLRLWVVERNEYARRFYQDHGFAATGADIPYEPDPRIHQVEMVLDL
ncbi:MAG: GCN5-related N-acetyltransferase [Acidimicrobiales bacterium]|nr:GCN5-related N-acetyltransferase [Acidimicrobiales bacterium]